MKARAPNAGSREMTRKMEEAMRALVIAVTMCLGLSTAATARAQEPPPLVDLGALNLKPVSAATVPELPFEGGFSIKA